MLTPAVMVAGPSIFERVFAIRARKGHREMVGTVLQGVKLRTQASPVFMARFTQARIARIANNRKISWRAAVLDFVKVRQIAKRGWARGPAALEGGSILRSETRKRNLGLRRNENEASRRNAALAGIRASWKGQRSISGDGTPLP